MFRFVFLIFNYITWFWSTNFYPTTDGFQVPVTSLQEAEVKAFHEQERKEVYKILDDSLQMCAKYLV